MGFWHWRRGFACQILWPGDDDGDGGDGNDGDGLQFHLKARVCSPGFVTPSSLTGWIWSGCHRAGVDFHISMSQGRLFEIWRRRGEFWCHEAPGRVSSYNMELGWWRFSGYLEQIFGKLRFHEGNISGREERERRGWSYKTMARRIIQLCSRNSILIS